MAPINPTDFVSVIDNSYFPLEPGTTYVTESPDGSEVGTFTVTRQTRVIDGVTCVVVSDISTVDGALSEKTSDYFAQDRTGNVWYFGEATATYENGHVVSTEGSWLAGVDGAAPGIVMEAAPKVGDSYDQENAPGVAEDHAQVVSLGKSAIDVPYGQFDQALTTRETSGLEPTANELKSYVKGIGFVLAVDQVTGEVEQLVKIRIDGTSGADKLTGKSGPDELRGHDGNDRLDGGHDHAADSLYGGAGDDRIAVRDGDRAYGGRGNDVFTLFDAGFGTIDGGSQSSRDLAKTHGDILHFEGHLTVHDVASRIAGIETISMKDGHGGDTLRLSAADVLDLGDGTFDPASCGHDHHGKGDAVRIGGDCGDQLTLTGGKWHEIDAGNAPRGTDVYVAQSATGHNSYVLVDEHVTVHAS